MFKAGTIIRNIKTGKPLKVLHAYKSAAVVIDLESNENPTPTFTLLERDWDQWCDESKMTVQEKKTNSWFDERQLIWKLA